MTIISRALKHCIGLCRLALMLALVGVIALAAGVMMVYQHADDEIHRRVQETLSAHYPDLAVHVAAAHLVEGEGIMLRDMSVTDPALQGTPAEVFRAEEVFLTCNTDLVELVQGVPDVPRMVFRRPQLRMTRMPDGRWSTNVLFPLPDCGIDWPAEILFDSATVHVIDAQQSPPKSFVLRDGNLVMNLVRPEEDPVAAEGIVYRFSGSFRGDHLRRIKLEGIADAQGNWWEVAGNVEALEFSPHLFRLVPSTFADPGGLIRSLRAKAGMRFRIGYLPKRPVPYQFEVVSQIEQGQVASAQFPIPLRDLEATLTVNNQGITIHELKAHSGDATYHVSGYWQGFGMHCPCSLSITATGMHLQRGVVQLLPKRAQHAWEMFTPIGTVDLDADVRYDGKEWMPQFTMKLRDVSFAYEEFPYPLKRAQGKITLRNNRIEANLVALAGDEPLKVEGTIVNPGPEQSIWVAASGNNLVLDDQLLRALPADVREVMQDLSPRGVFDLLYEVKRRPGADHPIEGSAHIRVKDGSLVYKHFPYGIRKLHGTLQGYSTTHHLPSGRHFTTWKWKVPDLVGKNDRATIAIHGEINPPREGGVQLSLQGTDVPLEGELHDALDSTAQTLWDRLDPQGSVNLRGVIRHISGQRPVIEVRIEPLGCSIVPVNFPYRVEDMWGTLIYQNGVVLIKELRGHHGRVAVSSSGQCDFDGQGQWRLRLSDLNIERLRLNPERAPDLFRALPQQLKQAVENLRPSGAVNLQGSIDLRGDSGRPVPTLITWDMTAQLHDVSIEPGIALERMSGAVTCQGRSEGDSLRAQCELDLDSVFYDKYQFMQVRGPVWIDNKQVILGSMQALRNRAHWHTLAKGERHITARIAGGQVFGDCQIKREDPLVYHLKAALVNGDLGRYGREMMAGRQENLNGNVSANLELRGTGAGIHTMRGVGSALLRDADIYEVPLMVSMLNILRLKRPRNRSFTESELNFRVEGKWIYFDQIDFRGDAMSLRGIGSMDHTTQDIQLRFYAVAGRDQMQIPVVGQVLGGTSRSLFQLHVDGTLMQPEAHRKAVPVVSGPLKRIFDELKGKDKEKSPGTAFRSGRQLR